MPRYQASPVLSVSWDTIRLFPHVLASALAALFLGILLAG
jgi:hypothetical protein